MGVNRGESEALRALATIDILGPPKLFMFTVPDNFTPEEGQAFMAAWHAAGAWQRGHRIVCMPEDASLTELDNDALRAMGLQLIPGVVAAPGTKQ